MLLLYTNIEFTVSFYESNYVYVCSTMVFNVGCFLQFE